MPKLIVPVDFSPTSAAALQYGVFLADVTGYDLKVIHVYDGFGQPDRLIEVWEGGVKVQEQVQLRLQQFVREHASPLAFTGSRDGEELPLIQTHAIMGAPPAAIVKFSQDPEVKLIVMGGVGAGDPDSKETFYYGSIAWAVALRVACPVLLIPKGYGVPRIEQIAFAFAEVDPLRAIVDEAEFLRHALGAEARMVHLMDTNPRREERKQYELTLAVLETAFPGYPTVLDLLPPGNVADTLAEYTLEQDIDLLVVGRRTTGLWRHLFVSKAQPLLTRCPVPLLIVPITPANH